MRTNRENFPGNRRALPGTLHPHRLPHDGGAGGAQPRDDDEFPAAGVAVMGFGWNQCPGVA